MRIALAIISIFFTLTTLAQQRAIGLNVEPHRGPIVPYASIDETTKGDGEWLQYSIDLGILNEQQHGDTIVYSTTFTRPFSWNSRQAILYVESASQPYSVEVDGNEVGRVTYGASPAEFNITRSLGKSSQLSIKMLRNRTTEQLESWREESKPSLGKVVVRSQPALHLRDVIVESTFSEGSINSVVSLIVKSTLLNARSSKFSYNLTSPSGKRVASGSTNVTLEMRGEDTIRFFVTTPYSEAWSADSPSLYTLTTSTQYRGHYDEYHSFKLGFRTVESGTKGVVKLNGLSQEIRMAEVGTDITPAKAAELKSKGINTLKLSAGEYNEAIYNYADSAGLYLVATAPINTSKSGETILTGGNPSNDPLRKDEFIERSDAIYYITTRHPSVVAYALADSSLNGFNLYESYLRLKSLEAERPVIYLDANGEWNSDEFKAEIIEY